MSDQQQPAEGAGVTPPPAPDDQTPPASPADPSPPSPGLPLQQTTQPSDKEQRNWALFAHLSTLSNYVSIPGFIGPLIIWLAKKDEMPFASQQAKEALNFQLSMYLYLLVAFLFFITVIGALVAIPLFIAIPIVHIIFTIVAAIKVSDGRSYLYPLTIRFIN